MLTQRRSRCRGSIIPFVVFQGLSQQCDLSLFFLSLRACQGTMLVGDAAHVQLRHLSNVPPTRATCFEGRSIVHGYRILNPNGEFAGRNRVYAVQSLDWNPGCYGGLGISSNIMSSSIRSSIRSCCICLRESIVQYQASVVGNLQSESAIVGATVQRQSCAGGTRSVRMNP
jgi:hypothetical protein